MSELTIESSCADVPVPFLDWDTIRANADQNVVANPSEFYEIGKGCIAIDDARYKLRDVVLSLRSKKITLTDWSSFQVAKGYIQETYINAGKQINDQTLEKYTGHLRTLLSMPEDKLPEKICISAPVRFWISPGDEVDVLDTANCWWHAVVLDVSTHKVEVFWVGYEKCGGKKRNQITNPALLDKNFRVYRQHEENGDTIPGPNSVINVQWIMQNIFSARQPKNFTDLSVASHSPESENGDGSCSDQPPSCPKPVKPTASTPAKKRPLREHASLAAKRPPVPEQASRRGWRADYSVVLEDPEEGTDLIYREEDDNDKDGDGNTTEEDGGEEEVEDGGEEEQEEEEVLEQESSREDTDQGASDSGDDAGPPLYHITQVFNDVDEAVETLVCLDAGLPPHPTLYNDMASKLTRVASFLAKMYSNTAYKDLVSSTLKELEGYEGRQEPRRFHSKKFLKALSKFGFCISPRMWMKEEILCIAISILDPRLDFQGIQQKDGINSQTSFRGMAVLNSSIQRIFYTRLRSYGFVNPRYHPERLQSFSSVVINGGGSWQKNSTWEFCKQSCFNIDKTASPFIVSVSSDVGALETAGVYVASTTKKNGKPVYVQVSKREFQGFSGQVAFNKCFKSECKEVIQKYTTNTQGPRIDACSPRVLVCLKGDHEWGIQLLPGYGSDFCICKFDWRGGQTSNIQRFASFDFDKFEAKMQPCALSITSLFEHAADCLTAHGLTHGHTLSFGTVKIMKSCFLKEKAAASFKITPLTPQGWHTDGPRNYNDSVFDGFGNLRSDAAACARRTAWKGRWTSLWKNPLQPYLTDHIGILQESFSALFGM